LNPIDEWRNLNRFTAKPQRFEGLRACTPPANLG
jgi:hypothetical protein